MVPPVAPIVLSSLPRVPARAAALALVAAGAVVAAFALAPLLVAAVRETRPAPADLRAALPDVPAGVELRLVASDDADAFAAGVAPGAEYVFVTDRLAADYPREEVAAVVAHELGHVEARHLHRRCGLLAVCAAGCALAAGVAGPGAAVAVLAAGVAALVALAVRQERAADAHAVRRVGAAATRRALARLDRSDAGGLARRACALAGVRTPLGRRRDRLPDP